MSLAASPLPAQDEIQAAPAVRPWLTATLLVSICAIYAIEVMRPVGGGVKFTPSIETLVAYGALVPDLVAERGEWYRLLTAPLLHGSLLHILMNGLALWSIGPDLERRVGRTWLFVLFFLGAIGGALGSFLLNPSDIVSVGASGAIMCLIAAAFVVMFHSREARRWDLQWEMLRAVGLSLVPLIFIGSHTGIDGAAHLGGAVTGFALGGLLWLNWEGEGPAPRWRYPARLLAGLGGVLFVIAIARAGTLHHQYALTAGMIPSSEVPVGNDATLRLGPALIQQYPNDPRSHWLQGQVYQLTDVHDLGNAERELRLALADPLLRTRFLPDLRRKMEFDLAELLMETGRSAQAVELAKPFCSTLDDFMMHIYHELCPPAN
ncbi:rhomboid family intramembrane serine protease [Dongia sp.]|uniref:rhomboid family intramembrane serine protease n=1 Tax=Dongia sp. TaxID=1977262 RepID=UPI0037531279